MNAVDTNVLLYAHDPRDLVKQAAAAKLLVTEVQRLYSEDFSAYQKIDTLEIVNPFVP